MTLIPTVAIFVSGKVQERENWLMSHAHRAYRPLLGFALRARYLVQLAWRYRSDAFVYRIPEDRLQAFTVTMAAASALLLVSIILPSPAPKAPRPIWQRTTRGIRNYLRTPRLRGLLAMNWPSLI